MKVKIDTELFGRFTISQVAIFAYLKANEKDGHTSVPIKEISKKTHITDFTVIRALKVLCDSDMIKKVKTLHGRGNVNKYEIIYKG